VDPKTGTHTDANRAPARLNKTEADFETLRDYNDYLETVEEITWNLILKIDVEATEKKLRLYEEAQKAERNIPTRSFQPDPSLPSDTAQVVLKKGASQRKALAAAAGNTAETPADGAQVDKGFNFRGLKKFVPPTPEKPLDPFDGWSIEPQYYIVQDDYDVEWLTQTKENPAAIAGGYDMREFYSRALCDAFSGFGVFIEDEVEARENQVSGDAKTGTRTAAAAAVGAKDVNMDDVF
jgi:CDK-activating kinase assembly factor MAT1